ncbi:MAG: hypothetical protein PVF37_17355, partial [Desulfobacterales bacterium]
QGPQHPNQMGKFNGTLLPRTYIQITGFRQPKRDVFSNSNFRYIVKTITNPQIMITIINIWQKYGKQNEA